MPERFLEVRWNVARRAESEPHAVKSCRLLQAWLKSVKGGWKLGVAVLVIFQRVVVPLLRTTLPIRTIDHFIVRTTL
jgi:hypothetical protein